MAFLRFELENIAIFKSVRRQSSGIKLLTGLLESNGASSDYLHLVVPPASMFQYYHEPLSSTSTPIREDTTKQNSSPDMNCLPHCISKHNQLPHIYLPLSHLGRRKGSFLYYAGTLVGAEDREASCDVVGVGFEPTLGWYGGTHRISKGEFIFDRVPSFLVSGLPLLVNGSPLEPREVVNSPFCLGDPRVLFDFGVKEEGELSDKIGLLNRYLQVEELLKLYLAGETVRLQLQEDSLSTTSLALLEELVNDSPYMSLERLSNGIHWQIDGNIPHTRAPMTIVGCRDGQLLLLVFKGNCNESSGITVREATSYCHSLGWHTAILTCFGNQSGVYLSDRGTPLPLCSASWSQVASTPDAIAFLLE